MEAQPLSPPVVTVQPTVVRSPGDLNNEMWNSSLFNCCDDMGICCFGLWCPSCLACQVSSDAGECLCLPMLELLTGGTVPVVTMAMRSTLRERYHIRGSICDDCCVATCCNICAWCQMARELKFQRTPRIHNTNVHVVMNPAPNAPPYAP